MATPLYTKTGDRGKSSTANGKRLPKSDQLFAVLGTLDELNSQIGLAVTSADRHHKPILLKQQKYLLDLGAIIAGSDHVTTDPKLISEIEKLTDDYQAEFGDDWYQRFLLPGGTRFAAHLDVARTVCRRLERELWRLNADSPIPEALMQYINRLSDFLFAMRCVVNHHAGYNEQEYRGGSV